ncbi:Chitinase 4 [Linum perenne]
MGNLQLLIAAIAILMATVVDAQVANIVTPAFFNGIRNRAPNNCAGKSFYTREAFIQAARSYPSFGNRGSDVGSKREIAAFFAHVTHETGINKGEYCDRTRYPCAQGKKYYGRGPLQLTWNYNYAECGKANNFDGVNNPDIVARDPVLAWRTALWFWINGMECNGGNTPAVNARVSYYTQYCQQLGINVDANARC